MTAEEWRPVVGWAGVYEVSDLGRVRRVGRAPGAKAGVILGGSIDNYGYPRVDLTHRGRRRMVRIHRLVAEAFIGPLPDGLETRHLDGDSSNPRLANLAYGTHAENMRDMVEHGRSPLARTHCPQGHPYDEANTRIDHRGARNCRICVNGKSVIRQRRDRLRKAAAGELYFVNVRSWGRANGFHVADTGRISAALLNAYDATSSEPVAS